MISGTDNKFNFEIFYNRWNEIEKMFNPYGIKVLGMKGDEDPRVLRAMKIDNILPMI